MNDPIIIDLFAEDRAHEEFLKAVIHRLARDERKSVRIRPRSARGGHGRALSELRAYQKTMLSGDELFLPVPDLLFIAIDANCDSFHLARRGIEDTLEMQLKDRAVIACPDPHVERWYLADKTSFAAVVGRQPRVGKKKCKRDYYKSALANAIVAAGHPPILGGVEFAREIVDAMDFYAAGRADRSLRDFVEKARRMMRAIQRG
ncbi:MAG: hypothetical protein AB1512_05030 [Thermodesulfobacteriota bacterium]